TGQYCTNEDKQKADSLHAVKILFASRLHFEGGDTVVDD
ncbi:MAG: hypothetical protein RLZZ256_378, partial [Bacteroidota bacterium]